MMPAGARGRKVNGRVLALVCVVLIAGHWAVILHRRAQHLGDFDVSREFGRRLLAGEHLYAGGLHYPYPPAAALFFAPFALVPPTVGLLLRYLAAIAALGLTLRLLQAMLQPRTPRLAEVRGVVSIATIVFGSHYLIRDLDDGGPHIILLAMMVGGMYCAGRGRPLAAAAWFGLGAALKAPQAIVLPLLAWKREWRLAAWTAIAAAGWLALPAVWMGPAEWWRHQRMWTETITASVFGRPEGGAKESEERLQNEALRPVVMRYVAAFSRAPHRGDGQAASGAGESPGGLIAALAITGVAVLFGWRTRRRYRGWADPRWPLEASGALLVALLASPATWVQHIVLILPALYLIVTEDRAIARLGIAATAAMSVYAVLSLLLNREIIGREWYLFLLSYGLHTACVLLGLGVLLFREPTAREASVLPASAPGPHAGG